MSARPDALPFAREERTIARALAILEKRLTPSREPYRIGSSHDLLDWACIKLCPLEREVFVVAFLDVGHRVIAFEEMFLGTLHATTVYPREVARAALRHNAAAVVLVHNHPSGQAEFSAADKLMTEALRKTLELVDVQVLDHLLIAGAKTVTYETVGRTKLSRLAARNIGVSSKTPEG